MRARSLRVVKTRARVDQFEGCAELALIPAGTLNCRSANWCLQCPVMRAQARLLKTVCPGGVVSAIQQKDWHPYQKQQQTRSLPTNRVTHKRNNSCATNHSESELKTTYSACTRRARPTNCPEAIPRKSPNLQRRRSAEVCICRQSQRRLGCGQPRQNQCAPSSSRECTQEDKFHMQIAHKVPQTGSKLQPVWVLGVPSKLTTYRVSDQLRTISSYGQRRNSSPIEARREARMTHGTWRIHKLRRRLLQCATIPHNRSRQKRSELCAWCPNKNATGDRLGQDGQADSATRRTNLIKCVIQDCARVSPVKGARDALRNLEGWRPMLSISPDRLLSLAIQATTERRASDHLHTREENNGHPESFELRSLGTDRGEDTRNIRRICLNGAQAKSAAEGRVPRFLAAAGAQGLGEGVPGMHRRHFQLQENPSPENKGPKKKKQKTSKSPARKTQNHARHQQEQHHSTKTTLNAFGICRCIVNHESCKRMYERKALNSCNLIHKIRYHLYARTPWKTH